MIQLSEYERYYLEWDAVHKYSEIAHKIASLETNRQEQLLKTLDDLFNEQKAERERRLNEIIDREDL